MPEVTDHSFPIWLDEPEPLTLEYWEAILAEAKALPPEYEWGKADMIAFAEEMIRRLKDPKPPTVN